MELQAISALKNDLARSFADLLAKTPSVLDSGTILKMIAMLIFTVHNIVLPRDGLSTPIPKSPSKVTHTFAYKQVVNVI